MMIRKFRQYRQLAAALTVLFIFKYVLDIKPMQIISGLEEITSKSEENVFEPYSHRLLEGLNTTARDFPGIVNTIERIGPGIDPRTFVLGNLTLEALAHEKMLSCNMHERTRLVSDGSTRVHRHRYLQEMQLLRTVVETAYKPDEFVRASTDGYKITLLTQITSDRTYMLDILLARWEGPVIAVIYVSPQVITNTHRRLCVWLSGQKRMDIKLILVQRVGVLYPVNWLRNLAIQRSHSKYILVSDGDFVPSVNLHGTLLSHLGDLERNQDTTSILLIPAFEMLIEDMAIPGSREDILEQIKLGRVDGFHREPFAAGHNSTNYSKWITATGPYILPRETPCNDHFEPYLVMDRQRSPYFPETLLERRKNKIAYQYEICVNGFQFKVVHNGFLVHKFHLESMRALTKVENCVNVAWDVFKKYVKSHHWS